QRVRWLKGMCLMCDRSRYINDAVPRIPDGAVGPWGLWSGKTFSANVWHTVNTRAAGFLKHRHHFKRIPARQIRSSISNSPAPQNTAAPLIDDFYTIAPIRGNWFWRQSGWRDRAAVHSSFFCC
ncbi:hypothetical protein BaRGS_00022599, partial [Batillaria attramentaria]